MKKVATTQSSFWRTGCYFHLFHSKQLAAAATNVNDFCAVHKPNSFKDI
jgi:hypothetical protein